MILGITWDTNAHAPSQTLTKSMGKVHQLVDNVSHIFSYHKYEKLLSENLVTPYTKYNINKHHWVGSGGHVIPNIILQRSSIELQSNIAR